MRKEETQGRKGKQRDGSSITRELKLGCVFTSHTTDEEGHPLRDTDSTTYVASFDPAEEFTAALLREARLRGLGKAKCKAVLGDGAHWIWKQGGIHFPQAVQILGYYHAGEHLSELAAALFPDKGECRTQVKKWVDGDHVLQIAEDAGGKLTRSGKRRKKAKLEIEYLRSTAKRMMCATIENEDYFVDSGVIEAGCKTVVGKRTKQSGMFWKGIGAQNILHIRCAVIGDIYDGLLFHHFSRMIRMPAWPALPKVICEVDELLNIFFQWLESGFPESEAIDNFAESKITTNGSGSPLENTIVFP